VTGRGWGCEVSGNCDEGLGDWLDGKEERRERTLGGCLEAEGWRSLRPR